jgi:hypothetical protein
VLPAFPNSLIDRVLIELVEDVLVVPKQAHQEKGELPLLSRAEDLQIGLASDEEIGDGRVATHGGGQVGEVRHDRVVAGCSDRARILPNLRP